jgi:hypothetical protein
MSHTTTSVDHIHPLHKTLFGDPQKQNASGTKRGQQGNQKPGPTTTGTNPRSNQQGSTSGTNNNTTDRPNQRAKKSPGIIKMKDPSKPCPQMTVKAKHHKTGQLKTVCKNFIVDGLHCHFAECAFAHITKKTRGQPASVERDLNAWVDQHNDLVEFKDNFNPAGVFSLPSEGSNNTNTAPAPSS